MRNIDKIRQMSSKELAVLFVSEIEKDDGDYNSEEEYIPCYVTMWRSPSGQTFDSLSYDDAITDCCKWLDSEYLKNDTRVYCAKCQSFYIDENENPHCEECLYGCDFTDNGTGKRYSERPKYREYKG